uniref:Uncharacterized protein n=1 Tax=Ralstonia solanacearum TaxID=305 RepID=A0A809E0H9_RALSL
MNTSPHALDATSTCASTHRARMTLAHDAMRMSVDDASMERADRSVHATRRKSHAAHRAEPDASTRP